MDLRHAMPRAPDILPSFWLGTTIRKAHLGFLAFSQIIGIQPNTFSAFADVVSMHTGKLSAIKVGHGRCRDLVGHMDNVNPSAIAKQLAQMTDWTVPDEAVSNCMAELLSPPAVVENRAGGVGTFGVMR